jgi:hypothetical protein
MQPLTSGSTTTATASDEYDSGLSAQISAAMAEYSAVPGVSEFLSVYEKYATVSGFDEFNSALAEKFATYALTQTYLTEVPTATDPAALATESGVQAIVSDADSVVSDFIATETYLPSGAKTSLASDFAAVLSAAEATGSAASKTASSKASATASGVETQASNPASALKAGMMGVAAAAGAAAAVLL